MSDKKPNYEGVFATLEPAPITFVNLLTPRAFERGGKSIGEPKYSATFLFPADSNALKDLKRHVIRLAKKKWPSIADDLKENVDFPWKKGEDEIERMKKKAAKEGKAVPKVDHLKGMVIVKASSKFPVKLAGVENGRIVDFDDEVAIAASGKKFYSGALCLGEFNFMPVTREEDDPMRRPGQKDHGFVVYLNRVVTTNKGERIGGGGKTSADVFKGYVGAVTDEDPIGDDEDF